MHQYSKSVQKALKNTEGARKYLQFLSNATLFLSILFALISVFLINKWDYALVLFIIAFMLRVAKFALGGGYEKLL